MPPIGDLNRVLWFGLFDGVALILGIGALSFVKRRSHLEGHAHVARILALIDTLLIASVVVFALVGSFWVAVLVFWIVGALRSVRPPIFTAWINQGLDPATRATVNSMSTQSDAIGQALAGPVIGGIGKRVSVPWAISVAGLLRISILFLYLRANSPGHGGHAGSRRHDAGARSRRGMTGGEGRGDHGRGGCVGVLPRSRKRRDVSLPSIRGSGEMRRLHGWRREPHTSEWR